MASTLLSGDGMRERVVGWPSPIAGAKSAPAPGLGLAACPLARRAQVAGGGPHRRRCGIRSGPTG